MSGMAWAFVLASVLIVVAGFVGLRTWQAQHSTARWMRSPGAQIAHAIPMAELRAELEALAHCGRWLRAELARDDGGRAVRGVRAGGGAVGAPPQMS